MKLSVIGALLAAALLSSSLHAAEPATGQVVKDTSLKKEPFSDAEEVTELDSSSTVQILARQGAWLQVQAGEHSGWLRLLAVRTTLAPAKSGDSGLVQAINVARSGSSGTSVATGVRGLSKEQIQNAQPNTAEADRMSRYSQSEDQARAFSQQKPALVEVGVDYLNGGKP